MANQDSERSRSIVLVKPGNKFVSDEGLETGRPSMSRRRSSHCRVLRRRSQVARAVRVADRDDQHVRRKLVSRQKPGCCRGVVKMRLSIEQKQHRVPFGTRFVIERLADEEDALFFENA